MKTPPDQDPAIDLSADLQQPCSDRDLYDLTLSVMRHEDDLINARVNWSLLFHGLLFSSYVGGVGLYEKSDIAFRFDSATNPVAVGLLIICGLGTLAALGACLGVLAAEKELRRIYKWRSTDEGLRAFSKFPPIYAHKSRIGASLSFVVLCVAWLLLAALVGLSVARTSAGQPTATKRSPHANANVVAIAISSRTESASHQRA